MFAQPGMSSSLLKTQASGSPQVRRWRILTSSMQRPKQALLCSARPDNKDITAMPSRIMKPTLTTAFAEAALPLTLHGIVVDVTNYKEGLKSIHTSCVQDTIANQTNKILNDPLPKIYDSEKDLPRRTRTTLSQLRSGYSPCFLQSYLARIMPDGTPRPVPQVPDKPTLNNPSLHLPSWPDDGPDRRGPMAQPTDSGLLLRPANKPGPRGPGRQRLKGYNNKMNNMTPNRVCRRLFKVRFSESGRLSLSLFLSFSITVWEWC